MPSLGSGPAEAPGNRGNPAFGRLSEALRATFATAEEKTTPSFGSLSPGPRLDDMPPVPLTTASRPDTDKQHMAVFRAEERSRSIESELDDILNEPLAGGRLDNADEGKSSPDGAGSQWAVWRTSPGKAEDGGKAETSPPAAKDKTGEAPAGHAALPPMPPSLGRPSGGFYPGSGFKPSEANARIEPSLKPIGPLPPQSPGSKGPADAGKLPSDESKAPAMSGPQVIARFDPKPEAAPPPPPASGDSKPVPDRGGGKPAPVVIAAMPASSAPPPGEKPAAPVAPPSAPATPPSALAPKPSFAAPAPSPAGAGLSPAAGASASPPGGISVPLPPRANLFSRPFSPKPEGAAPASSAAPSVRVPAGQSADRPLPPPSAPPPQRVLARQPASAPASALDALAAGLAASNASATTAPSPTPAVTATGTSAPPASAPRSLEDSVADMIKPMLQKWIDDNMPRIIEKALRNETGGKPPQS